MCARSGLMLILSDLIEREYEMDKKFTICRMSDNSLFEVDYDYDLRVLKIYKAECEITTQSDFRDCWSDSCGHYTESGPEYSMVDVDDVGYTLIDAKTGYELDGVQDWDNFDNETFESWANSHKLGGHDDWCAGSFEDEDAHDWLWDFYQEQGFQSDGNGHLISYDNGCYYDSKSGYWYDEKTDNCVF